MKYRQWKKNQGSIKEGYKEVRRQWRRWQGRHDRWLGSIIHSQRSFFLNEDEPHLEVRPGFIVWNETNLSDKVIKAYVIR